MERISRPAIDLETTPIEIKSSSKFGSSKTMFVLLYTSEYVNAGSVRIDFEKIPQYRLLRCTEDNTDLPISRLSTRIYSIWRITLTRTAADVRLQIHCNDVEVLNFLFSDETCPYEGWRDYWLNDVEHIKFSGWDTASDFYRAYQPGI